MNVVRVDQSFNAFTLARFCCPCFAVMDLIHFVHDTYLERFGTQQFSPFISRIVMHAA